ncbi:unnamed protein product, partial [Closterium sp. NIES-65]
MVHSVRRTGTPHDIVILTMNVSNRTLESLVALGAKIEPILEPVPYPFAVTADRLAINKPCRYPKLLTWNMVCYLPHRKRIYLDLDLLVSSNDPGGPILNTHHVTISPLSSLQVHLADAQRGVLPQAYVSVPCLPAR